MKFKNVENTKDPLGDKSFNFSLKILQLYNYLQREKKEYIISRQVFRSGTNPGAMIREAQNAESGRDFIHKLSIGQKEVGETQYWLELLHASEFISNDIYEGLTGDLEEIKKMIRSSILTKKKNLGIRASLILVLMISILAKLL